MGRMWPPQSVKTCPTPASLSVRATRCPPVRSAILLGEGLRPASEPPPPGTRLRRQSRRSRVGGGGGRPPPPPPPPPHPAAAPPRRPAHHAAPGLPLRRTLLRPLTRPARRRREI